MNQSELCRFELFLQSQMLSLINVMNETVSADGKTLSEWIELYEWMVSTVACMIPSFLWNVDGICQRHLKRLRNLE